METAILDIAQSRRRPTDQTLSIGEWPAPRGGTPLVSQTVGTSLDLGSFSLAGGDVLVRLSGPDLVSRLLGWWRLGELMSTTAQFAQPLPLPRSTSALDAARQLMELFDISMEALATASGVGRTTILHWQREGSSPRPSTVNGLWRLYGIGMGLRALLGVAGTRSWIRSGSTAPLALLAAGDMPAFDRLASALLFNTRVSREFEPGVAVGDELNLSVGEPMHAARGVRHRRSRTRRA